MGELDKLILEYLEQLQAGQERIEKKLDELIVRIEMLEAEIAAFRKGMAA